MSDAVYPPKHHQTQDNSIHNLSMDEKNQDSKQQDQQKAFGQNQSSTSTKSKSNRFGGNDATFALSLIEPSNDLLMVQNAPGGGIVLHDPALAAWSVDAIRIVRDQLYRASFSDKIQKPLPFHDNWSQEKKHFDQYDNHEANHSHDEGEIFHIGNDLDESFVTESQPQIFNNNIFETDSKNEKDMTHQCLPSWANVVTASSKGQNNPPNPLYERKIDNSSVTERPEDPVQIIISDIRLMAHEVSELLRSIEVIMENQRERRLYKVIPPPRILRNWYVFAISLPVLTYLGFKLGDGTGARLAKVAMDKIASFFAEHISEPLTSIYRELFTKKGREDMTDRKARLDTIEILKKMIKKWLNDTFPEMPEKLRNEKATSMDISLIEARKEQSLSNVLEMNNIIRMSLIEMQFIKKEMMNALYAIDDLMSTNEINIKVAAMTPALMILYGVRSVSRFLFYALLKIGKSQNDVYGLLRGIMLDIERLLVMRDHPPAGPSPPSWGVHAMLGRNKVEIMKSNRVISDSYVGNFSDHGGSIHSDLEQRQNSSESNSIYKCVLNSDDLGMLMLLVHEYRTILWKYRRRFTESELSNVSEDLAELTGEKGPVSVKQQLRIVDRMSRTYHFLMASKK